MVGLYCRMRLDHMLDLMVSQPEIRSTVESNFVVGLKYRNASELKQVLKVKLKTVLEFKCQVGL